MEDETKHALGAVAKDAYKDLQPVVVQTAQALATVVRGVNALLIPVKAICWGFEKVEKHLDQSLGEKLKDIPQDQLISPDPTIAVPAIQALMYSAHQVDLREMFTQLIATSMVTKSAIDAHPSFVDMIRNLTGDEAKILRELDDYDSIEIVNVNAWNVDETLGFATMWSNFAVWPYEKGCAHPNRFSNYLNNLCRLGLLEVPPDLQKTPDSYYDPLRKHEFVLDLCKSIEASGKIPKLAIGCAMLTTFGRQFRAACVTPKALELPMPH